MGAVLATPLRANGMFIASSAPKVPFAQKQGAHKSGKSGTGWSDIGIQKHPPGSREGVFLLWSLGDSNS